MTASNQKFKESAEVIDALLNLFLLPWAFLLIISGFMFDSPGSEKNLLIISLAASIWLYGPVYFISKKWAGKYADSGNHKRAFKIALLPVYDICFGVISFCCMLLSR